MDLASLTNLPVRDAEFLRDPHPVYAHLRENRPIFYDDSLRAWLLFRYDDVSSVLANPLFINGRGGVAQEAGAVDGAPPDLAHGLLAKAGEKVLHWLSLQNPPHHTRLKKIIQPGFSAARVARLEGDIRQLCESHVGRCRDLGSFDLITDLAQPLVYDVAARAVGYPFALSCGEWWALNAKVSRYLDIAIPSAEHARHAAAFVHLNTLAEHCVRKAVENEATLEQGSPIADLVAACRRGEISMAELAANYGLLYVASQSTTADAIGYAMLHLLSEDRTAPDAVSDWTAFTEEALRFQAPFQIVSRTAARDCELAGQAIGAGEVVYGVITSANRDTDRFPGGADMRPDGDARGHLSFGFGIHRCTGIHLARAVLRIALEVICRDMPDLALAGQANNRVETFLLCGLDSLPVTLAQDVRPG